MKRMGSTFEYEEARNQDLMRAYRQLCREASQIHLSEIYAKVVKMPSARFWVSEERTAIVIGRMLRGQGIGNMRRNKQAMYGEIYRRVCRLREEYPDESISSLVFRVVTEPAPEFYLTPKSAKVIINRVKSEWYERRKRKYRHLFM